ncbi:hypothetical protein AB1N83_014035 [Pleurotus pulmonarius]
MQLYSPSCSLTLPSISTVRGRLWRAGYPKPIPGAPRLLPAKRGRDARDAGHSGRGAVFEPLSLDLKNSRCIVNNIERQPMRHLRMGSTGGYGQFALCSLLPPPPPPPPLCRALDFDHHAYMAFRWRTRLRLGDYAVDEIAYPKEVSSLNLSVQRVFEDTRRDNG